MRTIRTSPHMINARSGRTWEGSMKAIIGVTAGLCLLLSACAQGPTRQRGPTFFPPLPQTPRVQFLTSISSEEDVGARRQSRFRDFVVGQSQGYKELGRLQAIGHEPGKIYLVDKTIENIVSIDLETGEFDQFRDLKGGRLQNPVSVFVAPDGYKYVADVGRNQVVVYNERNEYSMTYAVAAPFRPTDVVVYENRLYVSDFDGNQVIVIDRATGETIRTIGGLGVDEGFFRRPTHLTIDDAGNLFVVDSMNFRIQMFDVDGEFVKTFGYYEAGPGGLARPKGIGVDRSGHLYSVDAAFEVIQIYDVRSTDPLLVWGRRGSGPGSTYLPADIAIDHENVEYFNQYADPKFKLKYLIYQSNQLGNNKLNVYGFGTWTGKSSDIPARQTGDTTETIETPQNMPSLDDVMESEGDEPPEEPGKEPD